MFFFNGGAPLLTHYNIPPYHCYDVVSDLTPPAIVLDLGSKLAKFTLMVGSVMYISPF